MRLIAKWIAGLVVLLVVGVGIVIALEERAASQAKAFCDRFKPGTALAEAQRAAAQEIDRQYRTVAENLVSATFQGGVPLSVHVCTIRGADGTVSEARYSHAD
jgi:hypothetical protein